MENGITHFNFTRNLAQVTTVDSFVLNSTRNEGNDSAKEYAFAHWNPSHWNQYTFERNMIPAYVYLWILLVMGVPGNALVCYVYHIKIRNKQLSSNIFILALSWFDLVNCIATLPFEINVIYNYVNFDHPTLCRIARFTTFFCNNSTSVILLAIAIDRLRVFMSGPQRLQLSASESKTIVVIAMLISASVSWPMLMFFGTFRFPFPNGVTGRMCSVSNDYIVNRLPLKAFTITLLSVHLLFDLSFIVIYFIIGKRICYDLEEMRRMSKRHDRVYSTRSKESGEDDVFVTSVNVTKCKDVKASPPKRRCTALKSLNSSPSPDERRLSSRSESFCLSMIKSTDTLLRNSITSHCQDKKSRCASATSETQRFDRRRTVSRTSLMLFLVTIAYMVTYLPYCLIMSLRTINPSIYTRLSDIEKSAYQVFVRSYCLGSSINPLIYSFINLSFRRKCKEALNDIFCCFRKRR